MNTQTHEAVGTSPYVGQKPWSELFPTGKSSGIILEESLTDNGISTSTSDSVNESLQQSLGEMKEVLQSKAVIESNYSTDVGNFSVHVHREINTDK